MEQIQSMTQVLNTLDDIKKYLYVRSKEQDAGHIAPDLRTPMTVSFAPVCSLYSAGLVYNSQVLQYMASHNIWEVNRLLVDCLSQCTLTLCERNDLKPGNVAYMTNEKEPDFEDLDDYFIITKNDEAVHWRGGNIVICDQSFTNIFRVEIG